MALRPFLPFSVLKGELREWSLWINPSLQEEPSEQSCEYGEFETPKCSIVPIYVHSGHGSGVAVWKSLGDAGVVD